MEQSNTDKEVACPETHENWETQVTIPIHSVTFFSARETSRPKMSVTKIGQGTNNFKELYHGWLWDQLITATERRICKSHIDLLITRNYEMARTSSEKDWLTFKAIPENLPVLVRKNDKACTIQGIGLALKHVLTLLRAKAVHERSQGRISMETWRNLESDIVQKIKVCNAHLGSLKASNVKKQPSTLAKKLKRSTPPVERSDSTERVAKKNSEIEKTLHPEVSPRTARQKLFEAEELSTKEMVEKFLVDKMELKHEEMTNVKPGNETLEEMSKFFELTSSSEEEDVQRYAQI